MNGIGERTGNANLVSIIANLQLKMDRPVLAPERLARLTETVEDCVTLRRREGERVRAYLNRTGVAN